jgi:hypothetical protein
VEDADGDGRDDLLVGAYQESPGDSPIAAGRAYLFSGDTTAVAVEGGPPPSSLALHVPQPNPLASRTVLAFTLAAPGPVRLSVHDVLGREVVVLADGERMAGRHEAVFDGSGLPGSGLPVGVYFVRLEAGGAVATRALTLVR